MTVSDSDSGTCDKDVPVVPAVTDVVPVSPSSVVTKFCDGVSCLGSDWEFVKTQSLSYTKKRARVLDSYVGRDEV